MVLIQQQFEVYKEQVHSFKHMNYIPDSENKVLVLEFQCEQCGLEIFDCLKEKRTIEDRHGTYSSNEHQDTESGYWTKLAEDSYQLALRTPCVNRGGN